MSGGKGGSQTSAVQVPDWIKGPSERNLARAEHAASIGYTPYYGPDVAAMTPMQQASMGNTNQAAQAFGMQGVADPMAGMPQAQDYGNGMMGYSSGGMYDQALAELAQRRPAQYGAMQGMFIDPVTGVQGVSFTDQGAVVNPNAGMTVPVSSDSSGQVAQSTRDGGAFSGASKMITNPILTSLGESYNKASGLQKFLSPVSTGLGYMADRAIYNAGGEYNDSNDMYLQRGDIMLGRGSVDPTEAYQNMIRQQSAIEQAQAQQSAIEQAQAQQAAYQAASQAPAPVYSSNSGGGGYASEASRQSSKLDAGTGSGIGSGGGNASRGYSTGGW